MKTEAENNLTLHLFVCCNERANKEDCAAKGGKEVRDELKKWTKEMGYSKQVRINQSGCLGRCENGVAAVAYPQGEWLLNVVPDDVSTLKRKIEEWVVGAVLSEEQIQKFESGTLVTIEPLSRVKFVIKNRLSRIGKKLPMANEEGKVLFEATLTQAEVVRFDELPPVVLEVLGYGEEAEKFEKEYRLFWNKYFSAEPLGDDTQLWVCIWKK